MILLLKQTEVLIRFEKFSNKYFQNLFFISKFIHIITSFKDNYIKCSIKCVNITQQLFIKIDSSIIYNYSTFTELLVRLIIT